MVSTLVGTILNPYSTECHQSKRLSKNSTQSLHPLQIYRQETRPNNYAPMNPFL